VTPECPRVLIVDDEDALLFSLSDYLTFRGCRVDCARSVSDASALVHHLDYDAVVVGLNPLNSAVARSFAVEARRRAPHVRLVALASDATNASSPDPAPRRELDTFDEVLPRHLPIVHLARVLCRCIAA
jgi:DNA-binding NtrC family response regulator